MKILQNKFFIIGNLLLLLLAIPLTLFFVKKQQEVRSHAAPVSKLYFNPASPNTSTQCSTFNVDVMVDPGTAPNSNIVSIVNFYITYNPTNLEVVSIQNNAAVFPTVVRAASISPGSANMSVSVGADVTKAVQSISKVATITFKPKAAGSATVQFDTSKSRIFSLAPSDQPTENVLFSSSTAPVTITTATCPTGPGTPGTTGTPTPNETITPATTPAVTPATGANQAPACTDFEVTPAATGPAPFSVLFTAKGNDPDAAGLVAKTSFTFGDGQVQDVTDGMNLKNVAVQTNHTYQTSGSFTATVVFTDDKGAVSPTCNQAITVSSTASATIAPTEAPTAVPTAIPTVAEVPATGSVGQTFGIIGAVILTIGGGLALLLL